MARLALGDAVKAAVHVTQTRAELLEPGDIFRWKDAHGRWMSWCRVASLTIDPPDSRECVVATEHGAVIHLLRFDLAEVQRDGPLRVPTP